MCREAGPQWALSAVLTIPACPAVVPFWGQSYVLRCHRSLSLELLTLAMGPFVKATCVEGPCIPVMVEEVLVRLGDVRDIGDSGDMYDMGHVGVYVLSPLIRQLVEACPRLKVCAPAPHPSKLDSGDSFLRAFGTKPALGRGQVMS